MMLPFKCPQCGNDGLNVVHTSCSVIREVCDIYSDIMDYRVGSEEIAELGDTDHFQCSRCQYVLRYKNSSKLVQSAKGLISWIKENWDKGVCALEPNEKYMTATVQFNIPLKQFDVKTYTGVAPNTSNYATGIADMLNEVFRRQMFEEKDPWFHDYAFEVHQVIEETDDFPTEGQFFE